MKYFIALLLVSCSAYSQTKPLNPHPTKFMYPSKLPVAESGAEYDDGYTKRFGEKLAKQLFSKPHKFISLPFSYTAHNYILGKDQILEGIVGDSIDANSFTLIKDTLYFHTYTLYSEAVFDTEAVYLFQVNRVCINDVYDKPAPTGYRYTRVQEMEHAIYMYYLNHIRKQRTSKNKP